VWNIFTNGFARWRSSKTSSFFFFQITLSAPLCFSFFQFLWIVPYFKAIF
jgi:hypothetical protein